MTERRTASGRKPADVRRRSRIGSFQSFQWWCDARGLPSLPTDRSVVDRFVAEMAARLGEDELRAILFAIRRTHLVMGERDPMDTSGRGPKRKLIRPTSDSSIEPTNQ